MGCLHCKVLGVCCDLSRKHYIAEDKNPCLTYNDAWASSVCARMSSTPIENCRKGRRGLSAWQWASELQTWVQRFCSVCALRHTTAPFKKVLPPRKKWVARTIGQERTFWWSGTSTSYTCWRRRTKGCDAWCTWMKATATTPTSDVKFFPTIATKSRIWKWMRNLIIGETALMRHSSMTATALQRGTALCLTRLRWSRRLGTFLKARRIR